MYEGGVETAAGESRLHRLSHQGLISSGGGELGTTGSRVERALRHGVETVFYRISPELEEEMFWNSVSGMKGKPTNGEFLAIMVLHLEDN